MMKFTGWVFIGALHLFGATDGLQCHTCQLEYGIGIGKCKDAKDLGKDTDCGNDGTCISVTFKDHGDGTVVYLRQCRSRLSWNIKSDVVSSAIESETKGIYTYTRHCKEDGCNSQLPTASLPQATPIRCHECKDAGCTSEEDDGEPVLCDSSKGHFCETTFKEDGNNVKTDVRRRCAPGTVPTDYCLRNSQLNDTKCYCKSDLCNAHGLNYWHKDTGKPNPCNAAEHNHVSNIIAMMVAMAFANEHRLVFT